MTSPATPAQLCHYRNPSPDLQVIRLAPSPQPLEQVIFPGQRVLFQGVPGVELRVYTADATGQAQLTESILCDRLQVKES
jgi:hypothetical protein